MIPMLLAQPENYCLIEEAAKKNATAHKHSLYQHITRAGNLTMLVASITLLAAIVLGYVYYEHLSLQAQLNAHIVIIVASTAIKFGYIARCIGRHGLGEKQL